MRGHVKDDDVHEDVHPDSGISVAPEGDGSLVTLWGEVDASLRDAASSSMVEVLGRGGPVVIVTSGVTFIDSSGLAFVLQLYKLAEETGQDVCLRDPAPLVLELFGMIGLAGHMRVETTEVPDGPDGLLGAGPAPDLAPTGR